LLAHYALHGKYLTKAIKIDLLVESLPIISFHALEGIRNTLIILVRNHKGINVSVSGRNCENVS
jgi:hypothetical protein